MSERRLAEIAIGTSVSIIETGRSPRQVKGTLRPRGGVVLEDDGDGVNIKTDGLLIPKTYGSIPELQEAIPTTEVGSFAITPDGTWQFSDDGPYSHDGITYVTESGGIEDTAFVFVGNGLQAADNLTVLVNQSGGTAKPVPTSFALVAWDRNDGSSELAAPFGLASGLRAVAPVNGRRARTLHALNVGDRGGGPWIGVTGAAPGTYAHNGGTILVPASGPGSDGSAAWVREGIEDELHTQWWGFQAFPTTALAAAFGGATNLTAVNAAINATTLNGHSALIRSPSGISWLTGRVHLFPGLEGVRIRGGGKMRNDPRSSIWVYAGDTVHGSFIEFENCAGCTVGDISIRPAHASRSKYVARFFRPDSSESMSRNGLIRVAINGNSIDNGTVTRKFACGVMIEGEEDSLNSEGILDDVTMTFLGTDDGAFVCVPTDITTPASATMTVTYAGHGLRNGEKVILSGTTYSGGDGTIDGTYTATVLTADTFSISHSADAGFSAWTDFGEYISDQIAIPIGIQDNQSQAREWESRKCYIGFSVDEPGYAYRGLGDFNFYKLNLAGCLIDFVFDNNSGAFSCFDLLSEGNEGGLLTVASTTAGHIINFFGGAWGGGSFVGSDVCVVSGRANLNFFGFSMREGRIRMTNSGGSHVCIIGGEWDSEASNFPVYTTSNGWCRVTMQGAYRFNLSGSGREYWPDVSRRIASGTSVVSAETASRELNFLDLHKDVIPWNGSSLTATIPQDGSTDADGRIWDVSIGQQVPMVVNLAATSLTIAASGSATVAGRTSLAQNEGARPVKVANNTWVMV